MSDDIVLRVEGLHSYYGRAHILTGVTLDARRGEVVALMGRNGAGKSTTMKCIMGLVRPAQGRVLFRGEDITGLAPYRISRLGLAYVPEDRRVFPELTVLENLDVGRQPTRPNTPGWTAERLFTLFPNLGEMRDRAGGRMSGGEQQMLTIARSLMGNPSAVLLDEPSEGLAPVIVEKMAETVLELKQQGLTILLSEQNLHFAGLVADRTYVIEKGRICFHGSMQELAANEEIRRAYLTL